MPLRHKLTQTIPNAAIAQPRAEDSLALTPLGRTFVTGQDSLTGRPTVWSFEPGAITPSAAHDVGATIEPSLPTLARTGAVGVRDERHATVVAHGLGRYSLLDLDVVTGARRAYCAWSSGGSPLPYYLETNRGTSYSRGRSSVLCHAADDFATPFYTQRADDPIRPVVRRFDDVYELAFANDRAELRRRVPHWGSVVYSTPIPGTEACASGWRAVGGHAAVAPTGARLFALVVMQTCVLPARLKYIVAELDDLTGAVIATFDSPSVPGGGGANARLHYGADAAGGAGVFVIIDQSDAVTVERVDASGPMTLDWTHTFQAPLGTTAVLASAAVSDAALDARLVVAGDLVDANPFAATKTWITTVTSSGYRGGVRIEPGTSASDRTLAVKLDAQSEVHVLAQRGGALQIWEYWNDSDGDGISDIDEQAGIDIDGDGADEIDLPALGANPLRKTLLVWVDRMTDTIPTARLAQALGYVQQEFADAPIENPDGSTGIDLVFVVNPTEIPRAAWNGILPAYAVRDASFAGDPLSPNAELLRAARARLFRYLIFADDDTAPGAVCGQASAIPGSLAVVFWNEPLCLLSRDTDRTLFPQWAMQRDASTLMHELGHLVGFRHGGGDGLHGKPNYHSVMDYADDAPLLENYGTSAFVFELHYSSDRLVPSLDENDLDESMGLGLPLSQHGQHLAKIHLQGLLFGGVPIAIGPESLVVEGYAFDYNGDADATDTGLVVDLNGDGQLSVLEGANDWDDLDLRLYDSPGWTAQLQMVEERPIASILSDQGRCDLESAPDCFCSADGVTRACGTDVGACVAGIQTCGLGYWGSCAGVVRPRAELCDATDDDCDGAVDEDYPGLGAACSDGVGACLRSGTSGCGADQRSVVCSAVAGAPAAELCDSTIDEDCDGEVDEGFGDLGASCTVGLGACQRSGTRVCSADRLAAVCSAQPGAPVSELCGDGIDNDCDGRADQGCVPALLFPWSGYHTGSSRNQPATPLPSPSPARGPVPPHPLRPFFRWSASAPGATYTLQVGTPGFGTVVLEVVTAQRGHQPAEPLPIAVSAPRGTSYAWRVRAEVDGVVSAWSSARTIEVGRMPDDVDGDGYADLVVGSQESSPALREGSVHVYRGGTSAQLFGASPTTSIDDPANQADARFGAALSLGDLNGDGFGDLVIGVPGRTVAGLANVGEVDVYLGSAAGLTTTRHVLQPTSPQAGMRFGAAVLRVDDQDGDGIDDLWIGAPDHDISTLDPVTRRLTTWVDAGSAVLYRGNAGGGAPSRLRGLLGGSAGQRFGAAFAAIGDLDDDGRADLAVGAPETSAGRGAVLIVAAAGAAGIHQVVEPATNGATLFGASLGGGDVDGDGDSDLVVGQGGSSSNGALPSVVAFADTGSTFGASPTWIVPFSNSGYAGVSLAVRDIDWDGYADFVAGRPSRGTGGGFDVYRGQQLGPVHFVSYAEGEANSACGQTVTWLDADGTGTLDLAVGVPYSDSPAVNEGRVFVWKLGSINAGWTSPSRRIDSPMDRSSGLFGVALGD